MPLGTLDRAQKVRLFLVTFGFMCVASAALIGRTAGDALFLSRYDFSYLSYMYVGTALVVCGVAIVYGFFAGRVAPGKLVALSCVGLIALLLLLRLGLMHPWDGFRILAYLLGDLVVNLPMMLFWSFAALLFNPREAKSLFGFVGAGGTGACILAGLTVRPFVGTFGSANLLFVVAGLLCGFLLSIFWLSRTESATLSHLAKHRDRGRHPARLTYYLSLIRPPQIRTLIFLVLASHTALTLVDFQFKAGARQQFPTGDLAGFFGDFYGMSSIVALFFQLFLVHRVLQKGGVALGLCLLPVGLVIGSVGTYFTGAFGWIIGTKFIVQILLFTIDTAALQMLYLSIPVQSRSQARAFADGMAKPVAIAATGGILIGLAGLLPLYVLALGASVAAALWVWLARLNHQSYVTALVASLGSKRFDLSEEPTGLQDRTLEKHIRQSIDGASDEDALYLLSIGAQLKQADWTEACRQLLRRPSPEVKIQALTYLQDQGTEADVPPVYDLLEHPAAAVRCAAIRTLGALGDADDIAQVEDALADAAPDVRAAAIAVLINSGDLDRLIDAGIALKAMLQSEMPVDRMAAASALKHIRGAVLLRPLIGLLQDPDARVRLAALDAARLHLDTALIPVITSLLSDPAVDHAAAEVLAGFGSDALAHLIPFLALRDTDGAFQGSLHIPGIIAAIGDVRALPTLRTCLDTPDLFMRKRAIHAYCSLVRAAPLRTSHIKDLQALAMREMDLAHQRNAQRVRYLNTPGAELLVDALAEASHTHLTCAFVLLDAQIPGVDLMAILKSLQKTPGNRANALEILDNVLPKAAKTRVLAFFESHSEPPASPEPLTPDEIFGFFQDDESIWILVGALQVAVAHGWPLSVARLSTALDHANAIVREMAFFALHALGDPEEFRDQRLRFERDPDPALREFAQALSH